MRSRYPQKRNIQEPRPLYAQTGNAAYTGLAFVHTGLWNTRNVVEFFFVPDECLE